MTAGTADAVLVSEPRPGVRLLTLNRPDVQNAMTEDMTVAWDRAVAEVSADRGTRALVVTGAGSSFCAGADMSWLDQDAAEDITPDRLRDRLLPFYRSWLSPRRLPFPVIAAVNGPAVGAGVGLPLAPDPRFAAPSGRGRTPVIYPGARRGRGAPGLLPPPSGGSAGP